MDAPGHYAFLDMIRNRIANGVMRDETHETISIDDGLLINECRSRSRLVNAFARHLLKKRYAYLFG